MSDLVADGVRVTLAWAKVRSNAAVHGYGFGEKPLVKIKAGADVYVLRMFCSTEKEVGEPWCKGANLLYCVCKIPLRGKENVHTHCHLVVIPYENLKQEF